MAIDKHLMADGDTIYWDTDAGCYKAKQAHPVIIHQNTILTATATLDITTVKDTIFGNNSTVIAGITLDKIIDASFYIIRVKRFFDKGHPSSHLKKVKEVLYTNDIDNQGQSALTAQTIQYQFPNTIEINNQPSYVLISMVRNSEEPTSFILEGELASSNTNYTAAETINVKCKIRYKAPDRQGNR